MWTIHEHRVEKLKLGELVLAMVKEYFCNLSIPCMLKYKLSAVTSCLMGGTRLVQFKHGCKRGVFPDSHGGFTVNQGAEGLAGYRDVDDLKDALDDADRANPGFEECNSRPSPMMSHREGTVPGITQRILNQRSGDGDLVGDDAVAMVRRMRAVGEFRGFKGSCCGGSTDEDADMDDGEGDSYAVRVSMSAVPADTSAEPKKGAKCPVCGARFRQSKDARSECLERSAKSNLGRHAYEKGDDAHMEVLKKLKEADPDLDNWQKGRVPPGGTRDATNWQPHTPEQWSMILGRFNRHYSMSSTGQERALRGDPRLGKCIARVEEQQRSGSVRFRRQRYNGNLELEHEYYSDWARAETTRGTGGREREHCDRKRRRPSDRECLPEADDALTMVCAMHRSGEFRGYGTTDTEATAAEVSEEATTARTTEGTAAVRSASEFSDIEHQPGPEGTSEHMDDQECEMCDIRTECATVTCGSCGIKDKSK